MEAFYVSMILFVSRAWDAVTDPLVGYLVSRSRWTPIGKLMPWCVWNQTINTFFKILFILCGLHLHCVSALSSRLCLVHSGLWCFCRVVLSMPFAILSYVLLWFMPQDSMSQALSVPWFLVAACMFETLMSVSQSRQVPLIFLFIFSPLPTHTLPNFPHNPHTIWCILSQWFLLYFHNVSSSSVTMVTAWRTIHRSVKLLPFYRFSQPCLIFWCFSCPPLVSVSTCLTFQWTCSWGETRETEILPQPIVRVLSTWWFLSLSLNWTCFIGLTKKHVCMAKAQQKIGSKQNYKA